MLSFVGIDLTSSPKKPSAYGALGKGLEIYYPGFLSTDSEIIAAIDRDRPLLVAIDAPLSLPKGLCCLEEGCPCQASSRGKGRLCERELAKLGIPCFFTNKKSIIKKMVYRAIALTRELIDRGHDVIEAYPYASKMRLFGKPIPKKTTPTGLRFLKDRLSVLIPCIDRDSLKNHDLCDAVIAAYTAYLQHQEETKLIGDPEEGLISIPSSAQKLPI